MLCILSAMAAEAEVRPSQLLPCVLRPPFYAFLPAQPLALVASSALLQQQLSLPLQLSLVYPHKLRQQPPPLQLSLLLQPFFLAISAASASAIRRFSSALAFSYFLLWYHPSVSLHSLQQLRL